MTVLKLALVAILALVSPAKIGSEATRADRLLSEGLAHSTQSRYGKAISRFEAALGIYEELGNLRGRAECLLVLGQARTRLDTYGQALTDYQASLELWRRLEDPVGSWMVHFALAEARAFLEDNQRAFEDIGEANRILDEIRRDESIALSLESFRIVALAYGLPVENLAMVSALVPGLRGILIGYMEVWTRTIEAKILRQQGRYLEARSTLKAALKLDERLELLAPVLLDDLGEVFFEEGNYEKALDYFEQARDRAMDLRSMVRRDFLVFGMPLAPADVVRPYEVEALQHIAKVYMKTSRYEEALATQRRALAITKSIGDRFLQSALISDMGDTYQYQGHYARALSRYEKSLEMERELGSLDGEASVLNQISLVYVLQGRWEDALKLQMDSAETFRKMGQRAKRALALINMGQSYQAMAMHPEALDVFRKGINIAEEIGHGPFRGELTLRMAAVHLVSGNISEALAEATKAEAMARQQGDRISEVKALVVKAQAQILLGRPEEAAPSIEQALDTARADGYLLLQGYLELEYGLIQVKLQLPKLGEKAYLSAIAVFQSLGLEYEQATAQTYLAYLYLEDGRLPQSLKLFEEASRRFQASHAKIRLPELAAFSEAPLPTSVVSTLIDLHSAQGDAEAAFLHAERSRARALLSALGEPAQAAPKDGHRRKVEALRQHLATLERDLASQHLEPNGGRSARWTHLVGQIRETRRSFSEAVTQLRLNQPEYASIVDADVATLPEVGGLLDEETSLIAYYVLDSRVVAWVIDRQSSQMVDLPIDIQELGGSIRHLEDLLLGQDFDLEIAGDLHDRLFEPLREHVRHQRLILVPHGVLHSLPFAALWNAADLRFLAENYAITYAPSASVLRFLAQKRGPDLGRPLVLGNPDGSLAGAEKAAEAIARIHGTRAYLGAEATESRLRAEAEKIDVLHLAAHGVVDTENPRFSRIELAAGDGHDGRLELHELYWDLDLRGVNLVVLSACKTDRGHRGSGDEVLGLTRAFMYAGVPAVVTTGWSIDDEASRFLMETFHRWLRSGANAADALRAAQLATLGHERWSSPYYWAAFTLNGDGTANGAGTAASKGGDR